MKGLFIPEITAEMFRNECLESIEELMARGEMFDIDYLPGAHYLQGHDTANDEWLERIDKIRAKIEQIADEEQEYDEQWARGLRYATTIIDDYKAESEE